MKYVRIWTRYLVNTRKLDQDEARALILAAQDSLVQRARDSVFKHKPDISLGACFKHSDINMLVQELFFPKEEAFGAELMEIVQAWLEEKQALEGQTEPLSSPHGQNRFQAMCHSSQGNSLLLSYLLSA